MATIKGLNLRILAGPDTSHLKCIAASTNCIAHLSLQVEEDSTKDTTDDWLVNEPTGISWDVQVDALVTDTPSGALAESDLTPGAVYVIRFARTAGAAGEKNRDAVASEIQMTGNAILSDLQVVAQNDAVSTFSCKFTGTGDLTPYTP